MIYRRALKDRIEDMGGPQVYRLFLERKASSQPGLIPVRRLHSTI